MQGAGSRIRFYQGKTRIWNAAGEKPPAVVDLGLTSAVALNNLGNWSLPPGRQALTVLGSPFGHDVLVASHLLAIATIATTAAAAAAIATATATATASASTAAFAVVAFVTAGRA